jgi:hypothetical protein
MKLGRIYANAIRNAIGGMIDDSKPIVRSMRRDIRGNGMRGLKDIGTNIAYQMHPMGIRQAINEASFSGPRAGGTEWKSPADKRRVMSSYNRSKNPFRNYDPNAVADFKSAMKTLGKGTLIGTGVKLIYDKAVPEQTKSRINSMLGKKMTKRAGGPKPNKYFN